MECLHVNNNLVTASIWRSCIDVILQITVCCYTIIRVMLKLLRLIPAFFPPSFALVRLLFFPIMQQDTSHLTSSISMFRHIKNCTECCIGHCKRALIVCSFLIHVIMHNSN